MRIFYAAPDYALDRRTVDTKLWRANLYDSLVDLGHSLVEFQIDYQPFNYCLDPKTDEQHALVRKNRTMFSEQLIDQVRKAHREKPLDVFFSYFYSAYVFPEVIREIKSLGIPTVNWYCNASYQFHLVQEIAPAYDFCLVPERYRMADYRQIGANPIYCQEAANPKVYRPSDVPLEFDVTFVGQCYGNRPEYMAALCRAGVDARAWGPHWQQKAKLKWSRRLRNQLRKWTGREQKYLAMPTKHCGPPLSDQELIDMYSRSHISLGFTTVAQRPTDGSPAVQQVRLRDFEATMSGAFYMVEAFDELADFFEPDREIVFFNSEAELIEKAKYYLAHPQQAQAIREAALKRARAEHTWQKRFVDVFDQMGIDHRSRLEAA
jgi:spore maturation protein CgeB